jgi:hypothetical protein
MVLHQRLPKKQARRIFLMVYPICAAQYDAARGRRIQTGLRLSRVANKSSRGLFVN